MSGSNEVKEQKNTALELDIQSLALEQKKLSEQLALYIHQVAWTELQKTIERAVPNIAVSFTDVGHGIRYATMQLKTLGSAVTDTRITVPNNAKEDTTRMAVLTQISRLKAGQALTFKGGTPDQLKIVLEVALKTHVLLDKDSLQAASQVLKSVPGGADLLVVVKAQMIDQYAAYKHFNIPSWAVDAVTNTPLKAAAANDAKDTTQDSKRLTT